MSDDENNLLGHNNPPEPDTGWKKKYFFMPIDNAEIVLLLLKQFKSTVPKARFDIHDIIDKQIFFINRKMP